MINTVHIKGPAAIREAAAIKRLYDEAQKAQQDLRDELQRRADALSEEFQLKMLEHWRNLHRIVGLPEEEVGKWGLDARYLEEHGAAFLEKRGKCACGMDHGDDDEPAGIEGLLARITQAPGGIRH